MVKAKPTENSKESLMSEDLRQEGEEEAPSYTVSTRIYVGEHKFFQMWDSSNSRGRNPPKILLHEKSLK